MSGVTIPVSYRFTWEDGFGARGWKLDCSIAEPSVIAATAETGCRISTSVLVHDVLDHYLCGVGIGGHRNEAVAIIQLAVRTGSDPTPDLQQIIEEDILIGHINGESMQSFLPDWLKAFLAGDESASSATIIKHLESRLGKETLHSALLDHFLALGAKGAYEARLSFERHGLKYLHRPQMGLCLQYILEEADEFVVTQKLEQASGDFYVTNDACGLILKEPSMTIHAPLPSQ